MPFQVYKFKLHNLYIAYSYGRLSWNALNYKVKELNKAYGLTE